VVDWHTQPPWTLPTNPDLHLPPSPHPCKPTNTSLLDAFPSSAAFNEIAQALSSPADRADAIKSGSAIFAFTLKNKASEQESWYIDLKESGTVGKGLAPPGKKPGVTLVLSDDDFGKLVSGKANAQKLFMSGKLKVKGDVMKATKMEPILKKVRSGSKL
jgi:putative sterol carrier protein